MKNRKLILIVSLVLAMTMSLGGTLAYLTDTDADVNTMVLGNVTITQNEQEWNDTKTNLIEFTQDKPLLPYVGALGWENTEDGGAYRRFTMNNVVDKYVTVTNTGNTDAFVRTIIALEMGDYTYDQFKMIGVSTNAENGAEFKFPGAWNWTDDYATTIDGKNYNIIVAVHKNAVAPDETTIPSLNQVYLSKEADNEDVAALDGNGNGKYDILVISQAVQAQGFADAVNALNEAFGSAAEDNAATVASWFASIDKDDIGTPGDKNDTNNPPVKTLVVKNSEELAKAVADESNALIQLAENTTYTTNFKVTRGKDLTIVGPKSAVLEGQIAATSSGTLTLKGFTYNVKNINDSTGISQTGKSAIGIWGTQEVVCNDVTFNMSVPDSTAITAWWSTGTGANITVKNCEFNCAGQRPIRSDASVTVENTTFNDPYRYTVQLTSKASTATGIENAIVKFNNNVINAGTTAAGKPVYGLQLEGETYGCGNLIIEGTGNVINYGTTGKTGTMYYCECGKVDHETIDWNVEVTPVHAN